MKHLAITIVLLSLCLMAPAQKPIRHSSSSTTTTTTKPTKTTKPAKKPAAKPAQKPAKTTKPARRTTTTNQSSRHSNQSSGHSTQSSSYSNQSSGYSNQSSGYSSQPSYSSNATVPVPQAVDLGLNVRWASCNLGASRPEDYGYYYRWGETRPYNSGGRSTYSYTGNDKTSLGYSYDAVRANLGGSWRMPTEADVEEMMSKCTREAVTQNGVYGFKVTGPNGNSIFFPASGYHKPDDASLDFNDVLGYSWTSSFGNKTFRFSSSEWGWGYYNTAYGFPIRPVTSSGGSLSYSSGSSSYSSGSSSYSSSASVPVPQAVDLGLNVRWASCNLGASSPEDYGNYYRWGETRPDDGRGRSTYTYTGDSKTPLSYGNDAVRASLGGSWRMPTEADVEELMRKCKRKTVTQNGVYGFKVTGPNGNSIFFPASGYHDDDDGALRYNKVLGYSWSSSFGNKTFRFSDSEWGWGYYNSAYGFPIRPVTSSGGSSSYSSGSSSYSNQSSYSTTARVPVPRAVDLGLSVKWASFNLGASSQEEYGYYYRWADSDPAGKGMWDTYKYANGSETKLTKYCSDSSKGNNGFTDYKKMLDKGDDAARVNLGGSWRMPTDAEIEELVNRCTHVWTSVNGVKGIRVTGPNGNSIFLPANGCMGSYSTFDTDEKGDYWGSTSTGTEAYDLHFDKTGYWACHSYEYAWGFCIRPVRP